MPFFLFVYSKHITIVRGHSVDVTYNMTRKYIVLKFDSIFFLLSKFAYFIPKI